MKRIKLDNVLFEYYNETRGDITNIYYQNEELRVYYSTYVCVAEDEETIIEFIKRDYKTRIKEI